LKKLISKMPRRFGKKEIRTGFSRLDPPQSDESSKGPACALAVEFPILCCAWCGAPTTAPDRGGDGGNGTAGVLLFGGGGGAMKSGVANGFCLAGVAPPTGGNPGTTGKSRQIRAYGYYYTGGRSVLSLASHPELTSQVAAGMGDGSVAIFELEAASDPQPPLAEKVSWLVDQGGTRVRDEPSLEALAFSPNGKFLATGGRDQQVRVFAYDFVDPRGAAARPPVAVLRPEGPKPGMPMGDIECLGWAGDRDLLVSSRGRGAHKAQVIPVQLPGGDTRHPPNAGKPRMLDVGKTVSVRGSLALCHEAGSVALIFANAAQRKKEGCWAYRFDTRTGKKLGSTKVLSSNIIAWGLDPTGRFIVVCDINQNAMVCDVSAAGSGARRFWFLESKSLQARIPGSEIATDTTDFLQTVALVTNGSEADEEAFIASGFGDKHVNLHGPIKLKPSSALTTPNVFLGLLFVALLTMWCNSLGFVDVTLPLKFPDNTCASTNDTEITGGHDEL